MSVKWSGAVPGQGRVEGGEVARGSHGARGNAAAHTLAHAHTYTHGHATTHTHIHIRSPSFHIIVILNVHKLHTVEERYWIGVGMLQVVVVGVQVEEGGAVCWG